VQAILWGRQHLNVGPSSHTSDSDELSYKANELIGYLQIPVVLQLLLFKREKLCLFLNFMKRHRCRNAKLKVSPSIKPTIHVKYVIQLHIFKYCFAGFLFQGIVFVALFQLAYIFLFILRLSPEFANMDESIFVLRNKVSLTFLNYYPADDQYCLRYTMTFLYLVGTLFTQWNVGNLDAFIMLPTCCFKKIADDLEKMIQEEVDPNLV
jgi:hypothetical protein